MNMMNVKILNKNKLLLSLCICLIGVFFVALMSAYIVFTEMQKHTFYTRTLSHLSELNDLKNKNIEELMLTKSIFIFTSIQSIAQKKDLAKCKDWCPYINPASKQEILKTIKKINYSKDDLNIFSSSYKKLEDFCYNVQKNNNRVIH